MATQADVARMAGCDAAQVSRYFNKRDGVAAETCERIRQAAEELGYRPRAALSALAQQRWHKDVAHKSARTTVAMIDPFWPNDKNNPRRNRLWSGIQRHAHSHGYDVLRLATDDQLLTRIAQHQVRGVIIAFHQDPVVIDLPWDSLATVMIGSADKYPNLHSILPDYRQIMQVALYEALNRGYKRIGFAIMRFGNKGIADAVLSATLLARWELAEQGLKSVEICRFRYGDEKAAWQWYEKERPDCIISTHPEFGRWLEKRSLRFPHDVGFIHVLGSPHVAVRDKDNNYACVDRRHGGIGRYAFLMLKNLIETKQYGESDFPLTQLVPGRWLDGASV